MPPVLPRGISWQFDSAGGLSCKFTAKRLRIPNLYEGEQHDDDLLVLAECQSMNELGHIGGGKIGGACSNTIGVEVLVGGTITTTVIQPCLVSLVLPKPILHRLPLRVHFRYKKHTTRGSTWHRYAG